MNHRASVVETPTEAQQKSGPSILLVLLVSVVLVVRFLPNLKGEMHPAAKFQFERVAREFAQWRAVPEDQRSPAPGWWFQPAFEVSTRREEMAALLCYRLQLPVSSTYAAGAAVLMATLADQSSLPWPGEFPRKIGSGNG